MPIESSEPGRRQGSRLPCAVLRLLLSQPSALGGKGTTIPDLPVPRGSFVNVLGTQFEYMNQKRI